MPAPSSTSLRQWIWRAFVQSALIPLVLVEAVLIGIYLFTNGAIRDAQTEHLRQTALAELQSAARQQAEVINAQLAHVSSLSNLYRQLTAHALLDTAPVVPARLALSPDGVRYSPRNDGGPASFYSSVTPPERQDLAKVARLTRVDPLMKAIVDGSPLIASLYFNSWDSYNRIYPWFDTLAQYPADMAIPAYNFYYLADASHNPLRKVVWTDVYLDPAGHGWMMSAIAPVYRGAFLEGVTGVDITVDGILRQIGQLQVPWNGYAVLVSGALNIMALPKAGERDFGLDELTSHSYDDAIRREIFKPEDFNLGRHAATRPLASAMANAAQGVQAIQLNGHPQLVAWATIPQTGWHLLTVVDEEAVFHQTNALATRYRQIGYLLIAGLVVFYAGFFLFMWWRARGLSQQLRLPITGISAMMDRIGHGQWQPDPVRSTIREFQEMAQHTTGMGLRLRDSEAQRAAAQQRLELAVESATESLWERDLQTGLVTLRGRFCERFGLSPEPLDQATYLARVHPDDLPRILAATARVCAGEEPRYETEFRYADADGRYHWLLSRGRVLARDPDTGEATLLAGTHVDIDALKNTEADLRQAHVEALAASQAKSRFISSISHELRTPLNAIHGFAQLMRLERGERRNADEPDYVDEILMASSHLNQLVADILDWSSVQVERPRLELRPVAVAPLLRECAELVTIEAGLQGLTLNLDLPDEPLEVQAHPQRLRQVLLNLLSNAIKYNRPDGQITLTYQVAAGHIRLMVEDTGLGIEPHLQEQLFEPFQRLGRENTAIQGCGIGLSLCREFALLMGGQMGLHSEPGIGSAFWIELPLAEPAGSPPSTDRTPGTQVRPRVLYVEDNPASQFLVRKALGELAEVSVCSQGRVALERLLAAPPEILLLDLHLPDLSGRDLLQRLREHPQGRHLKVVVLSAAGTPEDLAGLEYTAFLAKPLDLAALRRLVSQLTAEDTDDVR